MSTIIKLNQRESRGFFVHGTNLSKTQKSITYAGSAAWNKILNHSKEAQSLKSFKVKLKNYLKNRDCNDILVKIDVKDSHPKPSTF